MALSTLNELTRTDTIDTGCVRYRDLFYVLTQDDAIDPDIDHSHLYTVDAGQLGYAGVHNWAVAAVTVCRHPHEQVLVMSPQGDVRLLGSGLDSVERIADGQDSPDTIGLLRDVRGIGQRAYAVGMGRQVYRRDDVNTWTRLHDTLRPAAPGEVKGFEAVDGFAEDDLYAAGWDGEIWHFDGSTWTQAPSPTDRVLSAIVCAGDGHVYAAGQLGTLVRGRAGSWEVLPQESFVNFWDLAWYGGQLYLGTTKGLYRLDGERAVPVDVGADRPIACTTLSVADGVLYTFGAKDLFAFDGQCWERKA